MLQELTQYLTEKSCDLDQESLPRSGLVVLWKDVRQIYTGFCFSFANLVNKFLDVVQSSGATVAMMTQCDYTGDLVYSGDHIGVLGLPLYHRSREGTVSQRRWWKCLIPATVVYSPWEDADHYTIGFRNLRKLLSKMCEDRGMQFPGLGQCNGDWTKSLRKHYQESLSCKW